MKPVTVSPKFQIVIPEEVRESQGIQPGQKVRVIVFDGSIHIVPLRPLEEMEGILKGVVNDFEREPGRI
jgi:AbrB family looped-hinge helix DNA binding protein